MKSAGRPASKWYDRSGCRDFSQGIVMYYCAGRIRHWQPLANLLEERVESRVWLAKLEGDGYGQESTYVQSIPMATRRYSNSLSSLAPRVGHPSDLLQPPLGGVAAAAGAGFPDL